MAESFCARCAAWADRFDMLPAPGGTLLCAVSGGADSVCLLLAMLELAETRGFRVACAHYDHRLRGGESARDAAFVRALCEKRNVPFFLGGGDVRARAEREGKGIEETAREMRYAFLWETAARLGAERLATAHTADDNAETMLLFLARGAGSRGLAGVAPRRGDLVRPLLFAERSEIEAFLAARGQDFITDSSNASPEYARNRLRLEAVPALRSVNAAFARHALEAAGHLREDEECLRALAETFLKENAAEADGAATLPADALAALPKPLRFRALRAVCGEALAAKHAEAVYALLAPDAGGRSADLPGLRVTRDGAALRFAPRGAAGALPERPLPPGGTLEAPEAGLVLRRTDGVVCPEGGGADKTFTTLYLRAPLPGETLTVRARREGDRLRLYGRGCSKSLKKLFSEARVPLYLRARTPVLACGDTVLAVPGLGAAQEAVAMPGEPAVKIEVIRKF